MKGATTPAQKELVIAQVLDGMASGQTLQDAAKASNVSASTVRQWIMADEESYRLYVKARLMQGQAMAEEAIRVARDTTNSSSASDRLLIETLKWAASKANPQEYGDKQTVEHQGAQTLQVKVIEDDVPVRNARAVGNAIAQSVVAVPIMAVAHLPATTEAQGG